MQDIDQFDTKHFEKVKGKQLYKINKHQYLKINKNNNGEIIAPIADPITKKFNGHNLICTGGTVWGTIKALLIVFLLLFLLWRYNVEVEDCLKIRANFDPKTGCISKDYLKTEFSGDYLEEIEYFKRGE